jgi:hypothetical protein
MNQKIVSLHLLGSQGGTEAAAGARAGCARDDTCLLYLSGSLMFNLQAVFAKDRAVVYRSYGDALAWSVRPDAATHVFARGLREGLWPHGPHCRTSAAAAEVTSTSASSPPPAAHGENPRRMPPRL